MEGRARERGWAGAGRLAPAGGCVHRQAPAAPRAESGPAPLCPESIFPPGDLLPLGSPPPPHAPGSPRLCGLSVGCHKAERCLGAELREPQALAAQSARPGRTEVQGPPGEESGGGRRGRAPVQCGEHRGAIPGKVFPSKFVSWSNTRPHPHLLGASPRAPRDSHGALSPGLECSDPIHSPPGEVIKNHRKSKPSTKRCGPLRAATASLGQGAEDS